MSLHIADNIKHFATFDEKYELDWPVERNWHET
jgi:hypothetical protein